jgi:hypothetical protein
MKASALIASAMLLSSAGSVFAQPDTRPELSGDIILEQEATASEQLVTGLDQAITFFSALDEALPALRASGSGAPPVMTDAAINYMTGAYLFCIGNNGKCPLPLEALFEADIIHSKTSGKVECPTLRRFWTRWSKNGMEERQNYLVKTGNMQAFQIFETTERPRFLRCDKTIEEEFSKGPKDAPGFFSARYTPGSRPATVPGKVKALLQTIRERQINVFAVTGTMPGAKAAQKKPGQGAPAQTRTGTQPRPPAQAPR